MQTLKSKVLEVPVGASEEMPVDQFKVGWIYL